MSLYVPLYLCPFVTMSHYNFVPMCYAPIDVPMYVLIYVPVYLLLYVTIFLFPCIPISLCPYEPMQLSHYILLYTNVPMSLRFFSLCICIPWFLLKTVLYYFMLCSNIHISLSPYGRINRWLKTNTNFNYLWPQKKIYSWKPTVN